jgi:hypothetical protein
MKNAFIYGILIVFITFAVNAQLAPTADSAEISYALSLKDDIETRQYKGVRIHRALAFTTGGLLLAADAMGVYHFLSMQQQGHDYRDKIGFNEDNGNETIRSNEIQYVWQNNQSQSERVIHGALIAASVISYVSTATIELTLPRMDDDSSRFSKPNIHRSIFYCHAALMLANIGLGFAESYALSKGDHNQVQGLGIAHMVVGIAAPVVMIGSGLVFKF